MTLQEKLSNTENKVKGLVSDILSTLGNMKLAYDVAEEGSIEKEMIYNSFRFLCDYVYRKPEGFLRDLEDAFLDKMCTDFDVQKIESVELGDE